MRIEIEIKMKFYRNGNRDGIKNDNQNRTFTPNLLFYLMELDTVVP